MPDDPLAPKNLGRFLPELKKFVDVRRPKIITRKNRNGNTIKGEVHATAKSFCPVCLAMSKELNPVGDTSLKEISCDECQKHLDQGMIAISCPDGRYSFVYSDKLADGKQHHIISNANYNLLEQRVKENQKPNEPV